MNIPRFQPMRTTCMNKAKVPPLSGANMRLENEFHAYLHDNLEQTRGVPHEVDHSPLL